ncbi:MAG: glycosyltransferase, partial [Pseudomonadota bacterium]
FLKAAELAPKRSKSRGKEKPLSIRLTAAARDHLRRMAGSRSLNGYVRDVLIGHGFPAERIVVHHIGIDTEHYERDPTIYREMSVLFVGRFVEKKGTDVLIRAMAAVQENNPFLDLVLIGSGPEELRLRRLARELGVRCRFLGWQSPDSVWTWMQKAEMLAVPSVVAPNGDCEGLPSVIFEANALCLPVVGSRHSGIPEGVEHGVTGLLSDEHDVDALAKNIADLHNDPMRRIAFGDAGREKALKEQDARVRAAALEGFFDQAVENHARLTGGAATGSAKAPKTKHQSTEKILVIRLSALGDFIISTGPMKAIRTHHANAEITLLTTAPYAQMGRDCGWFDEITVIERPKSSDVVGWIRLIRTLRKERFSRAYDFHQNDRTALMYRGMAIGRPLEWSGSVWGASHRVDNSSARRRTMHGYDKQVDQMHVAGIKTVPRPDISWMKGDLSDIDLPQKFAVMIPGAAASRPAKRWPAPYFAELATHLVTQGIVPVIIGGAAERTAARVITAVCPDAIDLVERTSIPDIADLARGATLTIGNDTGPMHVAAAAGAPCLVLYSSDSDPALTKPMGPEPDAVTVLQRESLGDLTVAEVLAELDRRQTP